MEIKRVYGGTKLKTLRPKKERKKDVYYCNKSKELEVDRLPKGILVRRV